MPDAGLGAVFVMVLMGCGDAGGQCEAVRTLPTTYASAAACNAAANVLLPEQTDVAYPVIAAYCQTALALPPVQIASAGS